MAEGNGIGLPVGLGVGVTVEGVGGDFVGEGWDVAVGGGTGWAQDKPSATKSTSGAKTMRPFINNCDDYRRRG